MIDVIQGPIVEIIDGSTFEMAISTPEIKTGFSYKSSERIKFELHDMKMDVRGEKSVLTKSKFLGANVRCRIKRRDKDGCLIADKIAVIDF